MRRLMTVRCTMSWSWISLVRVLKIFSKSAEESLTWELSSILLCRWIKESKRFTMRELFIVISNQTISLLAVMSPLKTMFISLILVLPSALRTLKANTFPLEKERIWQVLQDTAPLIPILDMNNQEETTLKLLDMCLYTSSEVPCLGKVSQEEARQRNMLTLRKRRRKWLLMNSVKIILTNSKTTWTIAEAWVLPMIQTIATFSVYSSLAWRDTMSM